MSILVKHSGNAAPTAWGAFAGGQGQRYAKDASEAMSRIFTRDENRKNRSFQAGENRKNRAFQANQAELGREFQADQNDANREFQSQEAERGREFQTQRDDLSFERSFEQADYNQMLQQENVEFGYSARQRAQFDQLSQAYEEAANSGEFTPDELSEVKNQIIGRMAGIERMPRLKRNSPYPAGQAIGETWASDDGRFVLTRDAKGDVKKLAETNSTPTVKDIADLYGQAVKALTTQNDEGADVAPDESAVEQWVTRAINLHQKFSGRQAQGQGSTAATPDALGEDEWGIRMTPNGLELPPAGISGREWASEGRASDPAAGPRKVSSDSDYASLPSGAEFVAPDGTIRRKP